MTQRYVSIRNYHLNCPGAGLRAFALVSCRLKKAKAISEMALEMAKNSALAQKKKMLENESAMTQLAIKVKDSHFSFFVMFTDF